MKKIKLSEDELKVLKLRFIEDKSQIDCSKEMGYSQPTFHRRSKAVLKKVSEYLIENVKVKK